MPSRVLKRMSTNWLCPSCKQVMNLHLGSLADSDDPRCPHCRTPFDPGSVLHAEVESGAGMGCAITSLILLGGWGLIGYLAMNSPEFGNIDLVWRWLLFAVPVLVAIVAVFLYCSYVARRMERRAKK